MPPATRFGLGQLRPILLFALFVWVVAAQTAVAGELASWGVHAHENHAGDNHRDEMLEGINLSNADLGNSNVSDSSFDRGVLLATRLERAKLDRSSFEQANLSGANLRHAKGKNPNFRYATLLDADLSHSKLDGADFTGANMTGVVAQDAKLKKVDLSGATLDHADLRGTDVKGSSFAGASLLGADLSGLKNAGKADFAGAIFDENTLLDPAIDTAGMKFVTSTAVSAAPPAVPVLSSWATAALVTLLMAAATRNVRHHASA